MVTKNFRNRKPLNAEPVDSHKNRSLARSSQARAMTMPTTASWIDPQKFSEPKVLNGDSLDRGRLLLACSENPFRHYIVAGTIFFRRMIFWKRVLHCASEGPYGSVWTSSLHATRLYLEAAGRRCPPPPAATAPRPRP